MGLNPPTRTTPLDSENTHDRHQTRRQDQPDDNTRGMHLQHPGPLHPGPHDHDPLDPLAPPVDLAETPTRQSFTTIRPNYTMASTDADVPPPSNTTLNSARYGASHHQQPVVVSGFDYINNDKLVPPTSTPFGSASSHPNSKLLLKDNSRRSSLTQSLRLHSLAVPHYPDGTSISSFITNDYHTSSSDPQHRRPSTQSAPDEPLLYNNRPHTNSAPPSPAAIAVLHPSAFIHTHHPRRGSLTPLNLNTISPVAPTAQVQAYVRRASHAQSSDGWSLSGGMGVRRKSLTPSTPSLAAASPTRIAANARLVSPERRRASLRPLTAGDARLTTPRMSPSGLSVRRASQPTVQEASTLQDARDLDPTSRRRSSVASASHDLLPAFASGRPLVPGVKIRDDFKFGEPLSAVASTSMLPRSRSPSSSTGSNSRTSPSNATISSNKFSDGESVEAERQRLAFMSSTYGVTSRSSGVSLNQSPGNNSLHAGRSPKDNRRGSLLRESKSGNRDNDNTASGPYTIGNEGYRRGSLGLSGYEDMSPGFPHGLPKSPGRNFLDSHQEPTSADGRRGSVPINIPRKRKSQKNMQEQPEEVDMTDDLDQFNEQPPYPSHRAQGQETSRKPGFIARPLPPLLPLSDPGPRLLPSTLALHRANHLLHSRNLESEPMPHPLPPSLHPPPAVDVTDFDIDFILAGATTPTDSYPGGANDLLGIQPSGNGRKPNDTLKLGPGGDDEDTFAKFVGAFDEEYDDRRDGWTFKACLNSSSTIGKSAERKPGQPEGVTEWQSLRAGRYTISSTGDVTSLQTGRTWRVVRKRGREYEIGCLPAVPEESVTTGLGRCEYGPIAFVLASKTLHNELGGVKVPRQVPLAPSSLANGKSTTDSFESRSSLDHMRNVEGTPVPGSERNGLDSPSRSSPMLGRGRAPSFLPSRRGSRSQEPPVSHSALSQMTQTLIPGLNKDVKKDKRDKPSIGDKIKGSWLAGFNKTSGSFIHDRRERKEEKKQRQREKQQSQSWSGTSTTSSAWNSTTAAIRQSNRLNALSNEGSSALDRDQQAYQPPWLSNVVPVGRFSDEQVSRSRALTGDISSSSFAENNAESPAPMTYKPGKAWTSVPDDAVAMVIPLIDETLPLATISSQISAASRTESYFQNAPRESLLVYFVPFVSGADLKDKPSEAAQRPSMTARLARSKSKEAILQKTGLSSVDSPAESKAPELHPLPFRSFRIVARVVEPGDLRSEPSLAEWPDDQEKKDGSQEVASPIDTTGTRFPTVIAVCHSRSQGVEFVLEGLDRLGLCEGNSAWGPTGYEEWRGSGLSRMGRNVLDILWTGCVAILGLTTKPQ